MRAVGEGRLEPDASYAEELDFCLVCRHCESVCPAGVRFGEMMEFARAAREEHLPRSALARLARWIGFRVVLPRRILLRALGSLLRAVQTTRLDRLLSKLAGERGSGIASLPRVAPLSARRLLPGRAPAQGERRGEVLVLEGCVMPEFFAHVNRATVASLNALQVACRVPQGFVCCGSLHAHNGDRAGARALAKSMIEACERELGADGSPLEMVVNSAGCGAHMKALQHLFDPSDPWHGRAAAFAQRVRDYAEFVAPRMDGALARIEPGDLAQPIAWDDPCHLCHGQGIRQEPRAILAHIEGLERVELPDSESCCGSAGIYSLVRPADSAGVFARKLAAWRASGARTLVTANPGCHIQFWSGFQRAGVEARVVHLAELVAHALARGRGTSQPPER
jgi:glycolate oxidase iron-sulfur subunit